MDCFFEVDKVFANDDIDKDAVGSFFASYLDGEDHAWSPIFEKSVDKCIAIKKGVLSNCMAGVMLIHCVINDAAHNCPANLWTSSMKLKM